MTNYLLNVFLQQTKINQRPSSKLVRIEPAVAYITPHAMNTIEIGWKLAYIIIVFELVRGYLEDTLYNNTVHTVKWQFRPESSNGNLVWSTSHSEKFPLEITDSPS